MSSVQQETIDLFRRYGLTTWFGNPGSSELTLLEDFPEDFRYVLGLQEMVPVGMADAYAQVTGRPAVVNVHTAPGLGNAQGALYNAFVNKTPLIVTAGNQRRFMQNQYCLLTNIDPTTVPKPFVKWAAEPAIASETPAVLAHAIHLATTPPMGPVFVSLPMDDMQAELDDTQAADVAVVRDRKVTRAVGLSRRSRRGDLRAHRGRYVTGADRGWRCGTLRGVGRRDRVGRTHPVCRVDGPTDRVEWIPRESPVVSGHAATGCGLDLPSVNGPRFGGGDRGTGVPVLPARPRTLSAPRHKPDSHHQRSRRSRPGPGGGRDHRRRALRRSGPARCGQTNPATRSTAARPDPRRRARGNTAQTRNTMGGRRACRTRRHAVGQRGRQQRVPHHYRYSARQPVLALISRRRADWALGYPPPLALNLPPRIAPSSR